MIPLERNQEILLEITALNSQGQGVGRYEGYTVFVPGALPGETVRVVVIKPGNKYGVGKLCDILQPSPQRVQPACAAFSKCGGCALQHFSYPAQLEYKAQQAEDAFRRIGGIDARVMPVLGMEMPYRYRNKAAFPYSGDGFGFYSEHSHKVIPIADCLVVSEKAVSVMQTVQRWASEYAIAPYDEVSGGGTLRHVLTRVCGGEVMAAIVARAQPRHLDELVEMLKQVQGVASIILNINPKQTNVILGRENTVLWGEPVLIETLLGMQFEVSVSSFLQVNSVQTERLYETALEYAALGPSDVVIDAYCGVGTIALLAATRCSRVTGIEIAPEAIENAKRNAQRNEISNARFICAPAESKLMELAKDGQKADVIFLDPPRKGCEKELLRAAALCEPKRIVYVSCNPATLARDCAILAEHGYSVLKAQPVDMFAHTTHVECVCLLEKG